MTNFVQQHQQELIKFARQNDIKYLALFGSHARGKAREDSDVDMIVDFNTPGGLLRRASVMLKLEELLGKKVDLLSKNGVNHMLEPYIKDDLVTIYEKKA